MTTQDFQKRAYRAILQTIRESHAGGLAAGLPEDVIANLIGTSLLIHARNAFVLWGAYHGETITPDGFALLARTVAEVAETSAPTEVDRQRDPSKEEL